MKQANLLFLLITALAFASCRPTARQTVADAEQPTDSTCMTGEAYTIEQRLNDEWTVLSIKPKKDGAVYAFNDIGYELAPHSTRLFTIHVDSDKYDFERGQEYRIVKEFFKKGKKVPQNVYCYFSFE